ncbi:MAG: hypothetical protein IPM66_21420 [Acidobacteriota bacterium]|nr:MAG: hypothetical protein IPM66_21420 [Acidobacteriota bacterium]
MMSTLKFIIHHSYFIILFNSSFILHHFQKGDMSRKKTGRKPARENRNRVESGPDSGRRKFILGGAGAAAVIGAGAIGAWRAGWFGGESSIESSTAPVLQGRNLAPATLSADAAGGLAAANQMLEHYARDLNNPSALIHAVRGFGKGFTLADGTNAVDHLCSNYAADKEVNGRRYVYFKREAEVHENSFLKTFLEAGVGLERAVTAGGNRYTLRDVAESGKALFRCDPSNLYKYDENQYRYDTTWFPPRQNAAGQPTTDVRGELVHEHLPWGLIAFSIHVPKSQSVWTNAWGDQIDLRRIIDRSLAQYEGVCALGMREVLGGQAAPKVFRDEIKKYSCFGLHTAYAYLVCLKNGYADDALEARIGQMVDFLTWRLKADAEATVGEYAAQGTGAPPQVVEAFRVRALIKLYGHAFETINYARLHKLIDFSPSQLRRIEAGEQAMYENLVRMRALDWGMLRNTLSDKFISDIVIALGHAARAMKLLTPQNPDALA